MSISLMKEIGGFFQLELDDRGELHRGALRLNSGRNALRYILKAVRPKRVHMPHYCCDSLLEPLELEKVPYSFYHIKDNFEPVVEQDIGADEYLLYIDYFGINGGRVRELSTRFDNLIIDNAQAFFSEPIKGAHTLYSPRKFFGVPDGGYLYTDKYIDEPVETDVSYENCEHLLKRVDLGAEGSYGEYLKNEESFSGKPVRFMSELTKRLLSSIDYESVKRSRTSNFNFLHENLGGLNELDVPSGASSVPMVYPLLCGKKGLRDHLISKKVFVATYWKEVLSRCGEGSVEHRLADELIPLPVDQRYGEEEMGFVVETVKEFYGS